MEIYQGIEVHDKVTLGFVRKIQTEFGKTIDKIDWEKMGVDEIARVLIVMVLDANPKMKKDQVEKAIDAIPFDEFPGVMERFRQIMSNSFETGDDEVPLKGNLTEQDGKKSTSP
jgi:hypothetical protein